MEDFLRIAGRMGDKTFRLYALGTNNPKIVALNAALGNRVEIKDVIQPSDMPREYKKHEWLIYTASRELNTVGWPVAIAEAQASGVGVCMQRIRPDLEEYVGDAGYLFETVDEAVRIVSQPFPEEKREQGFEQAKKSDARKHISILQDLWSPHL